MAINNLIERLKKVIAGIRQDVPAATVDGDQIGIRVNENGELMVVSGSGTGTPNFEEDSVHVTADFGTQVLAVRNDTLASLVDADGDYAPLQVDASGALYVNIGSESVSVAVNMEGPAAQDAAVIGNPMQIACESADFDGVALPSPVGAEGDIVRPKASLTGIPYMMLVNEDGSATPQVAEADIAGVGLQISLDTGAASVFAQGDTAGNTKVVGPVANGTLIGSAGSPELVAGTDGANLRTLLVDTAGRPQEDLDRVGGTDVVTGGIAGLLGVGGPVADGTLIGSAGYPHLVAGSDGANLQTLLVDSSGRPQNDIDRVGGTDVVTGGIAGLLGVSGPVADGTLIGSAGYPILVAGTDGANLQTISVDASGNVQVELASQGDVNIAQVAGSNTVDGGPAGTLGIGGPVADGVASTQNPVVVGGVDAGGLVQAILTDTDGRPQNDIDRVGGTDVVTGGIAGLLGVSGPVADGTLIGSAGYPILVAGTDGANLQTISVDASGNLQVELASQGDVNIAQVGGTNTVDGGPAGTLGIGGPVADGVASTQNPVVIGGVDAGGLVQAVLTDTDGRPQNDVDRVGGTDVVTGGIAGLLGVGGPVADGTLIGSAGYPHLVAGSDGANLQTLLVDTSGRPQNDVDRVGGIDVVTGGVAGTLGVGGPVADGTVIGSAGYPHLIAGTDGANLQTVSVDSSGNVQVELASQGDVNIAQVGGTNTVDGGPAGTLGVGGPVASGVASTQNPVIIGGVTGGTAYSLLTDTDGRPQNDLDRIGGVDVVATAGVTGMMPVAGDVADNGVASASGPVKVGAVAEDDPDGGTDVADADLAHLIVDLQRRLWVRSAAYDPLVDADVMSPTITDADRYVGAEVLIDGNTAGVATYYFPSSAGLPTAEHNHFCFSIESNTNQTISIEGTNDVSGAPTWFPLAGILGSTGALAASIANANDTLSFADFGFAYIRVSIAQLVGAQAAVVYMRRRYS